MEPSEQISQEWSSLGGVYTAEEADFMNQLLGNCSIPEQLYENFSLGSQSAFWPGHESTVVNVTENYFPAQVSNTNLLCLLQGSNSSADSIKYIFPTSGGNYFHNPANNFGYMSMSFSLQGNDSRQKNDKEVGLDTGREVPAHKENQILDSEPEEDKTRSLEKSGKRCSSNIEVSKNKRNVKSKKNPTSVSISNTKEDENPGPQSQALSSFCSDDDSNALQELHGGASSSLSQKDSISPKLSEKSRSSRGPATDPQSVYARRRRERINERLRILQNLVPNGTKVDISTMLEEAVQYVKFLQLQIKLLSSDDLWMYAPIAYNGMNIGLELNINPIKQPNEMHSIAIKEYAAI